MNDQAVPFNWTHPVGRRSDPGIHHADDCPMRHGLVMTGCFCGREGERDAVPIVTDEATEALVGPAPGLTVGCGTCDSLPGNSGCHACGGTGRLPRPEVAGEMCPWRESHYLMESCSCGLLGPRPLLDRNAVKAVLAKRLHGDQVVDRLMELARPMPTREQIAGALHAQRMGHPWLGSVCNNICSARYYGYADAVLALLNGAES